MRADIGHMKIYDISADILGIILSIEGLNVGRWRYKYIFWLLDSLLNRYPNSSLPFIYKICSSLTTVGLKSNERISSLVIFLS